jgi:5-hydroxyisourate hydrolase/2-oxo-4-hydroxy-4-carboxy-5-ureidoimidazoline decarboxylase
MNLQEFNNKERSEAREALFQCCSSTKWADTLMNIFPFESEAVLVEHATNIWYDECNEFDWRESFTHHPKIGDIENLEKKFASTLHLAGKEQSGIDSATKETIQALAQINTDYEDKNGFIFIVCATGKSAEEMLKIAQDRLSNLSEEEVHIAMGEQAKITIIRFKKLMPESNWSGFGGSQLTSHVLDTSTGVPGKDLTIKLQQSNNGGWQTVSQGVTNADGRVADLLAPGRKLEYKNYKMIFDTGSYFKQNAIKGFYPEVEIQFTVIDDKHYHVPLLINPFGYTTYRGS